MSNKWVPLCAILLITTLFGCAPKIQRAASSGSAPAQVDPTAPASNPPTPSVRTTHEPLIPETPIKPKSIPANTLPMEMIKEK